MGGAGAALPLTAPLPNCGGQGETLPLPWVYRSISSVLPPDATIELEAIELIAAAVGEFLALVTQQAAAGAPGGVVDSAALLRALRELGYDSYEELLAHFYNRAVLTGGMQQLRATAAAAAAAAEEAQAAAAGLGAGGSGEAGFGGAAEAAPNMVEPPEAPY